MLNAFFSFFLTAVQLVVFSQGALFSLDRGSFERKTVCTTDVCKERAEVILSLVNETLDPCDNFYLYACGKRKKHGSDSPMAKQYRTVKERLKEMVDRLPNVAVAKNATEKAGMMYKACMDKTLTDEQELALVKKALEDKGFAGWPLLRNVSNPQKSMEDVLLSAGLSGLLLYDVLKDVTGEQEMMFLTVAPKDSAFEDFLDLGKPGKMDAQTIANLSLVTTAAEMLRPDLPRESLLLWSNATTSFLLQLNEILTARNSSIEIEQTLWKATIKEVESSIPKFPLLKLLNNFLKEVNLTFSEQDKIIIVNTDVFNASLNFLLNQDPIDVFNYVGSRAAVEFLVKSSKKFRLAASSVFKKELHFAINLDNLQSTQCYKLLEKLAPNVITSLYVQNYFNDELRREARSLLNKVGTTYYERLKLVPWMDRQTKDNALKKLWHMSPYVGFSNDILNRTWLDSIYAGVRNIRRNDSLLSIISRFRQNNLLRTLSQLKNPTQRMRHDFNYEDVNGYYVPSLNALAILAGILDGVFFKKGLPDYINLGGVGTVMGHEITHGYDDTGSQFDARGRRANWWNNFTLQEFEERAGCFVQQYGSIFDPLANLTLDGEKTLGENIADNGGLRMAFTTYVLTQYDHPQVTLPGLEKYTPEQLFFISAAILWCTTETPELMASDILHDEHSPPIYRVNVPMQNMEEFSAAFQCKPGSFMRLPEHDRCVMW